MDGKRLPRHLVMNAILLRLSKTGDPGFGAMSIRVRIRIDMGRMNLHTSASTSTVHTRPASLLKGRYFRRNSINGSVFRVSA